MTFITITASVGKNGQNKVQDTFPMQIMLNKFIIPGCLKPTQMLAVDGIIGKKTIAAIRDFQRRICGFSNPDGRIDPGGETLKALNGPLIWAKPSAADTTREWAIALEAISIGLVEFKLVNRALGVVNKLAIRNPGISQVSVNKSFSERWVSFQTSLASGFDDFDNVSASFSKADPLKGGYMMTLGWLGSVPVSLIPAKSFSQACPVTPVGTVSVSPAFSSILGCNLASGFGSLGQVKMLSLSQQLEFPKVIITPDPKPVPYPVDPNLWSPLSSFTKQLLLAP
jgi:hypothetical protein